MLSLSVFAPLIVVQCKRPSEENIYCIASIAAHLLGKRVFG